MYQRDGGLILPFIGIQSFKFVGGSSNARKPIQDCARIFQIEAWTVMLVARAAAIILEAQQWYVVSSSVQPFQEDTPRLHQSYARTADRNGPLGSSFECLQGLE